MEFCLQTAGKGGRHWIPAVLDVAFENFEKIQKLQQPAHGCLLLGYMYELLLCTLSQR